MTKLTPKQEAFCREMVKPKANQTKAYRKAFNAKGMSAKTVNNEAHKLMKSPDITARIEELTEPVVAKVQMTREEWLIGLEQLVQGVLKADTRKMHDAFGNPIEIREIGDHEEKLIEGYEFEETYTKVKKADGDTDAVPTGYVKKYKLTSRVGTGIKAAIEFGKVMGWHKDKVEVGLESTLEELVLGSMKLEAEK